MAEYRLGKMERRFADIIWTHGPLSSGELARLCKDEFLWKKSTTYTILRRLCDRGLFRNREGVVSSIVSKQEFLARQSEEFVEEAFAGSLPRFLAAFSRRKKLTEEEIEEIRKIIDENGN